MISKRIRQRVFRKFGGRCAYSGTPLEDDWQVDHYIPKRYCESMLPHVRRKVIKKGLTDPDVFDNLMPAQKIVNHYKRALTPIDFKNWYLGGLHERLAKLPKNPRTEDSIKHKEYMLKVAGYFGITPDKPFDRIFYFERLTMMRTT